MAMKDGFRRSCLVDRINLTAQRYCSICPVVRVVNELEEAQLFYMQQVLGTGLSPTGITFRINALL